MQQVLDRYVSPALDGAVRLGQLGEVPADAAVHESVLRRELLMERQPGAPPAVAMVSLATRLLAS